MRIFFSILFFLTLVLSFGANAQEKIWFTPNKGQWETPVVYKSNLNSGEMILEKDGFTYHLHNASEQYHAHHEDEEYQFKGQVIRSKFVGSNVKEILSLDSSSHYKNFYLSQDKSKWKSKVREASEIVYEELYSNIDLKIYSSKSSKLKYDYILKPGADLNDIQVSYAGMNGLKLKQGALEIQTEFGEIIESKPYAYQIIDGNETEVQVNYFIENNTVRFIAEDYDESIELIIDPELTFSSFTGSTADNWGYTATPDSSGNLYAGGIVFGIGYPFITGSYNPTFAGGQIDIGISKFNASGTNLLYSTYIGGTGNESPHSLVVNHLQELYVLGSTASPNYPTTNGAHKETFTPGGDAVTVGVVINYPGSDIIVSRFSQDGTELLASTYVGGSDVDGLSYFEPLRYNYGDDVRGEITVDENSNVYFASTTKSLDFPMVNAFNTTRDGQLDGVVVKLDPNLENILFSSLIGGNNLDVAYSVQLSGAGDIFVAGGTNSSNFQGVTGGYQTDFAGGQSDGYVLKINGTTYALERASYLGTGTYNQAYFVQLDLDDDVYVFGQTVGGYPISGSVYNNPNSGQFIHKLSNDLTTSIWSTVIGSGSGNVEISPTAFLVSDCYDIFISGWGGVTNQTGLATGSSSNGFPVTADAYQSTTTGNNFYLAVLDRDAEFLKYATYFGGNFPTNNHVDGGTSRFDKKGSIYHAVCASCGVAESGFTTTPNAWSTTVQSNNCNLAAFKFDLGIVESAISVPEPFICIPDPINFNNDSQNGNAFIWDFGDGNTSTAVSPSHLYTDTGTYVVTLITIDTLQCFTTDTSQVVIQVSEFQGAVVIPQGFYCPGSEVQLEASGGSTYLWSPAELVDNPNIANPIATVEETTQFSVIVSDSCGTDTLSFTVNIFDVIGEVFGDTVICLGDSIQISSTDAQTYDWQPAEFIVDNSVQSPIVFPNTTTEFIVDMVTNEGCELKDTVLVEVELDVPQPDVPDILNLCQGTSQMVTVSGGDSQFWSPNYAISDVNIPNPIISAEVDTFYVIGFQNICGVVFDTLPVDVIEIEAQAWNDTIICPGEQAFMFASGGVSYNWFPQTGVSYPNQPETFVTPTSSTTYGVIVTDQFGCSDTAYVNINLFPLPYVIASPDYYGIIGDSVEISADGNGNGTYVWIPNENMVCDSCQTTTVAPEETQTYTVFYVDENGCKASDQVTVYFDGLIYVPNAFTPDGNDDINPLFKAEGGNIDEFYMAIFNRWGELIFESEDMEKGWDGTYKGQVVQDGVYVWKILYKDVAGNYKEMHGHVSLLK